MPEHMGEVPPAWESGGTKRARIAPSPPAVLSDP
jgi:hypothetical protein